MKIAQIYRFLNEKIKKNVEEDEMTSAILSTAPQGGALSCGDNYAPGDMRVPKLLGKIQRRKKEEDAEQPVPPTLYRYMSLEEISELLSYGAFTRLLDFDEDCDGKVKNPAGNMPFFKSFTYKLTKAGLEEFMGPGHVICVFNTAAFPKNPLLPYTYDDGFGATHEYEYRLFAKSKKVPCDVTNLIKAVIFCKASEGVDNDEVENLLLDLNDSAINAEVFYVDNPLRKGSKKIVFELDENDELVSRKA